MNIQRFVLPATLAAAFHAALLYGMTHDGVSVGVFKLPPVEKCSGEKPTEAIELPPPVEDEEVPQVVSMPKGSSRSELQEVYTEMREATFVVEPQWSDNRRVVDTGKLEPLGVPDGVGTGVLERGYGPQIVVAKFLDQPPRAKVQMPPDYPSAMKTNGLDGTVMVEFDVDVKGRVVSARVRESTDRAFEEPTLRAVLKWRFEPGQCKGVPVPFRMVIPVNFKLGAD